MRTLIFGVLLFVAPLLAATDLLTVLVWSGLGLMAAVIALALLINAAIAIRLLKDPET